MAKKITVVGATPRKIEIVDQPKRRLDPADLAAALGAAAGGRQISGTLDPLALAELGTELLGRLRSSGGRPALADATVNCRVPLSVEDVSTLETLVARLAASTGAKPSIGQLASVIVRLHLNALRSTPEAAAGEVAVREADREISRGLLQQLIDEQLRPIREQVQRLETELRAVCAGGK